MITIREIQGTELLSPYAGEVLTTQGAVTGLQRRGFFLQTEAKEWDGEGSDGVFVYSPEWKPEIGQTLMVTGAVIDFIKHDTAKPVTQIHLESAKLRKSSGVAITAIEFTQSFLPKDYASLSRLLNSLEGMLVKIPAGHIVKQAIAAGLLLVPAGKNVVRLVPPLNITAEEVDIALERLERAIAACAESL